MATRRKRERAPDPHKFKRPNASAAHKALWATPEYREKMRKAMQHVHEKQRGNTTRRGRGGIPDGMRHEEAEKMWAEARESARKTMDDLKESGALDLSEKAAEALEASITIMRSAMNNELKLRAARQVLDFTQPKPVSKQHITVDAAEAWLAKVADDSETTEDAEASA